MKEITVQIKEIKQLLNQGKQIYVESIDGYQRVSKYIEKGVLETFEVTLTNGKQIRVSKNHLFFQRSKGWIFCKDLIIGTSLLLCQDGKYHKVKSIQCIGYHNIVDITVQESHCYYGNGIMNHNSGKSLLCSHLIKSCQELDGIPVLIDTEAAANWEFMEAIGVNTERVIYYDNLKTLQKIHKSTQELMYSIRQAFPDKPILIIVDSITATSTEKDLQNKDYENKGYYAALKAKMNSEALRKLAVMASQQDVALVYTSQLRQKMDVMNPYMDQYEASSGGKALSFYASLRVRMAKKSKLKEKIHGVETVVGVRTKARIDKSRMGATNRECEFDVRYDCGVMRYTNWLQTLKKYSLIEGKGTKNLPWVVKHNGVEINIGNDFVGTISNNEEVRNKVYDVLADVLILKYKSVQQGYMSDIIVQDV